MANPLLGFAFLLARDKGMLVEEMLERMSTEEFVYWLAYHQLDPIGPARDDIRQGITNSILIAGLSSFGGKPKIVKPDTFVMTHQEKRPQTEEEQKALFKALASFHTKERYK